MEQSQTISGKGGFAELRGQFAELREGSERSVTAGHLDLGPGLWLSSDPAGRAMFSCQPSGEGFALRLEEGDTGAWACLGMRVPVETLRQGRYLGLLVTLRTGDLVSFTPTLRYYRKEGMQDVPTDVPVILAGGPRRHLSHIPIDPALLDTATSCELNLFFHTDRFVAEFSDIEPVLIL